MQIEHYIHRIVFSRLVRGIESTITISQGIPSDWDKLEIMDWISYRFGDLLDAGWLCTTERVENGYA